MNNPEWLEAIKGALRIESLWMPPEGENDPNHDAEFAALVMMRNQFKAIVEKAADHSPISELKAALHADPDYAWSWLCNLACIGTDSGGSHERANGYAATFMKNAFDVDVRTHQRWKDLEAQWAEQSKEGCINEPPTLEEWINGWEAARESGQSSISRDEAERRYYREYGRRNLRPNGEG